MPNKYKYDFTLDDQINEENREVRNDLMRAQTEYYNTLVSINKLTLSTLNNMSLEERKQAIRVSLVRI